MKRKIILFFLIICFCVPMLTGCYDYREPNTIAYVIALGIDKGSTDGIYKYSIQYARPTQITGGASEGGGKGEDTSDIISIESPSVYSAINLANHVISKTFTLSHTKVIVVSEEIAKNGISPIIDTFGRNSDIRPTVYFCIANESAEKYLSSVKPSIEINPAKYYELIFENNSSSYTPFIDAQKIYFNYKNGSRNNVIPYVGAFKNSKSNQQNSDGQSESGSSESEKESGEESKNSSGESDSNSMRNNIPLNESGFEYHIKEYISGNMDIDTSNESEELGAAVFKGDKMIGTLNDIECKIYNIINGTYKDGYTSVYSEYTPLSPITILLVQNKKPDVKVNVKNDVPYVYIKLHLNGDFISTAYESILEDHIDGFEQETCKYIKEAVTSFLNKTTKEYNSDIFGFYSYAKRYFLTYEDMINYNWEKKYGDTQFFVDVDFNIKRTGLIIRSEENTE